MKDILDGISKWEEDGKQFCIATVTKTWRSAPRPVGSSMIISTNDEMMGSVSGGCVEKSVVSASKEVFENSKPRLLSFGVQDEEAWNVGLSCGGRIEVLLEKFPSFISIEEKKLWIQLKKSLEANQGVVWVSSLNSDSSQHYLLETDSQKNENQLLEKEALSLLNQQKSGIVEVAGKQYFVQSFPSRNRLLIIGSAHITSELLILANMYDFETIVIDPRNTFATKTEQKVQPDQLLVNWPQEVLEDLHPDQNTYVVVLTHDPKIDDAALEILLRKPVKYIGALGSKKTHEKRKARLTTLGFSSEELDKIHGPIGLDINALSAKEIALSIMGEVIKLKNTN